MDVRRILQALVRRKWVVVATLVATLIVVGFGVLRMQPIYSASALVRVAESRDAVSGSAELGYADRLMNTYLQLLRSRPVLDSAAVRANLPLNSEQLLDATRVELLANTELIRITADSSDPKRSAAIANALADTLVEQRRPQQPQGRTTSDVLQEQLGSINAALKQDRLRLAELSSQPSTPEQTANVQQLQAEIRFKEQTYASLLTQYDRARLDEALRSDSISVVEAAAVPVVPSKPNTKLYMVLAALAGLLSGLALALLLDRLDPRLSSPGLVENDTGFPVLGLIPELPSIAGSPIQGAVLDFDKPSPAVDAFRLLAVHLLRPLREQALKTLLLVSPDPAAGRTMVAVNLAGALAREGNRVILVDADMTNPSLHRVFGLPNEQGLRALLAGASPASVKQQGYHPGLNVVVVGSTLGGSFGGYSSAKIREALESLSRDADLVLVDGPALSDGPDSFSLSSMADAVLVVVAEGTTEKSQLEEGLKRLTQVGARVAGIIYNRVRQDDRALMERWQSRLVSARGMLSRTHVVGASGSHEINRSQ